MSIINLRFLISFLIALSFSNSYSFDAAAELDSSTPKVKSVVFPIVVQALNDIVHGNKSSGSEIHEKVTQLILKSDVAPSYLKRVLDKLTKASNKSAGVDSHAYLPADDEADRMIKTSPLLLSLNSSFKMGDYSQFPTPASDDGKLWPKMALHSFKIDVINPDDDMSGDDIYCYYFVTDGVIPTGKTTGIYHGVSGGQSFFLNEMDRLIYPVSGIMSASPSGHLIVDYGIIESDGDDVKNMQKITSIIIDIALTIYNTYNPSTSILVENLRKEVKNLANALLALNNDDRLVTSSVYFQSRDEVLDLFGDQSFFEFEKLHEGKNGWSDWGYNIHFRALKN